MKKRIVYTRHDGGVSLACPTPWIFGELSRGGWAHQPAGFVDEQIDRQIKDGIHPDHAARYARAMVLGGVPEWEVWSIIKDRDCARKGTLHELQSLDDLPPDRWFRDAWRRSSNGGPPSVDLEKAKPIQWQRIVDAVSRENKRRELDLFGPAPIRIRKTEYQTAIKHARDDEELRRIWVPSLPQL